MEKTLKLTTVFIVVLISSIILTSHHYKREYKVNFWGHQNHIDITGFEVVPEDDLNIGMFNNSFDVYVKINCTIENDGFEEYVEYVHKSERLEIINGEKIIIVEFTPVISHKNIGSPKLNFYNHEEKFKYTMNNYDSGTKKYIFRCGEFEEILEFHSGK